MFFLAIPSLIVAPFWGPWTDKSRRRKPALLAPAIGAFLGIAVMLMVMYFEWPLYVMFIGSALAGLSGFLPTLSLAIMAYITDTTEKNEVAFRLGKENVHGWYLAVEGASLIFFRYRPQANLAWQTSHMSKGYIMRSMQIPADPEEKMTSKRRVAEEIIITFTITESKQLQMVTYL